MGAGETSFKAMSRREFLRLAWAGASAIVLTQCSPERRALGFSPRIRNVTPFITPNPRFYLVAVDPSFRPAVTPGNVQSRWSLTLEGPGGASRKLACGDLTAGAVEFLYTFECIGNPLGGPLIGNARWTGVPMKKLLRESGLLTSSVRSVMFRGLDDFYSSISIERVLSDYSFLAVTMNGEPLPPAHGFPARSILPDLYGMKQPRWLQSITLQETSQTTSFWEKRGWAGEVPVKTTSRLDPVVEAVAGSEVRVTGIAFAGKRGIDKVELSLDGGQSWGESRILQGGKPDQWATWQHRWKPETGGGFQLQVRATDGTGAAQVARSSGTFPDGATGYDTENVTVRKS